MTGVGKEQFHENMTSNDHMLLKEVNQFITILCIFLDLHVWFITVDVHNTLLSDTEFHEIRRSEKRTLRRDVPESLPVLRLCNVRFG